MTTGGPTVSQTINYLDPIGSHFNRGHDDTLGVQVSISPQTLCLTVLKYLDIPLYLMYSHLNRCLWAPLGKEWGNKIVNLCHGVAVSLLMGSGLSFRLWAQVQKLGKES